MQGPRVAGQVRQEEGAAGLHDDAAAGEDGQGADGGFEGGVGEAAAAG